MATRLPLFPLGTVLVPGLVLPLHIFEPRYRQLVSDLQALPEDERTFGVVATRAAPVAGLASRDLEDTVAAGPPPAYLVGCTAHLQDVTAHPDGRFDVITVGQERFRIQKVVTGAGTPYLQADVVLLEEVDGEGDLARLAETVALRFAAYRERLRVEQAGMPSDPQVLSYLVSAAVVMDLAERQALLAAATTADRLRSEAEQLRREVGLLDTFAAMPAVDLVHQPVAPN